MAAEEVVGEVAQARFHYGSDDVGFLAPEFDQGVGDARREQETAEL